MEPRGKGRGVGRGRAGQGQQRAPQQQPQQQRPGGQPPSGQQQQQPQAWVRPAQPGVAPQWPRPPVAAQPVPVSFGRGSVPARSAPEQASAAAGVSGVVAEAPSAANNGARGGNGSSVRGARVITSQRDQIIYTRPAHVQSKTGTSGSPIDLLTNYVGLKTKTDWGLIQYRVDFAPEIEQKSKMKRLFREGVRTLLTGGYLFDGTVLFSAQVLHDASVELIVDDEGTPIRITIKRVGNLAKGQYQYIQLFNLIMRRCLRLMGLQEVGRQYYSSEHKVVVEGIELWPGFYTSLRQHERDILLCVDLSFKFMRRENCYTLLHECASADFRAEYGTLIVGGVVFTGYNNKTYRVDEVDFNQTPNSTFQLRDGSTITFKQYYRQKYNIEIRYDDQPLLVSRSKPREIRAGMPELVVLVPELCQLTGLTSKQRENMGLMRSIANHTRVGVDRRIEKLMEFVNKLNRSPECLDEVRKWDLSFHDQLLAIKARVLPRETILSGNNSRELVGQNSDWTNTIRSRPMFHMPKIERLAVIVPQKMRQGAEGLMRELQKAANGMQFSLGNPRIFDIPDDRSNTYLKKIDEILRQAQPSLFLTILPNQSLDRYSAIKKKLSCDLGIPSQAVVGRTLNNKGLLSIATKIAIQINAKIGGCPWSVLMPLSSVMIVGYDVCRDTTRKGKSFSGFVATMDKQMSRYFNMVKEHSVEEELSMNFAAFLVTACKKYKQLNGQYPTQILIYRDGVGEGMIPYVVDKEVKSIENALTKEIYTNNDLKMCFIIVNKRINTKFFYRRRDNPPPGTVVDDVVTLAERYDFYLISQCVRQGTVAPTYFEIVHDTMKLPADKLQILTYKLTHMYYNWSGTIRVPAPCQYAHKLAFIVSQSLHQPAHADLELNLHFL